MGLCQRGRVVCLERHHTWGSLVGISLVVGLDGKSCGGGKCGKQLRFSGYGASHWRCGQMRWSRGGPFAEDVGSRETREEEFFVGPNKHF